MSTWSRLFDKGFPQMRIWTMAQVMAQTWSTKKLFIQSVNCIFQHLICCGLYNKYVSKIQNLYWVKEVLVFKYVFNDIAVPNYSNLYIRNIKYQHMKPVFQNIWIWACTMYIVNSQWLFCSRKQISNADIHDFKCAYKNNHMLIFLYCLSSH